MTNINFDDGTVNTQSEIIWRKNEFIKKRKPLEINRKYLGATLDLVSDGNEYYVDIKTGKKEREIESWMLLSFFGIWKRIKESRNKSLLRILSNLIGRATWGWLKPWKWGA